MKYSLRSTLLCFALALLTLVPLCLFSACASDTSVKNEVEIPEGWEVVSEGEDITYLKLKEGSDAYYWRNGTPWEEDNVFFEMILPNEPELDPIPLEAESITVLFYYGYGYFDYDDENGRFVMTENEAEVEDEPLRLLIDRGAFDYVDEADVEICTFEGVYGQNNVVYEHCDDLLKARIGLSRAALVKIPMSAFRDNWEYLALGLFTEEGNGVVFDTMDACKFGGYLHFTEESVTSLRGNFPYVMWNAFFIILPVLALAAIALMIIGTVKRLKWMYLIPWIPCAIGVIYSVAAMEYFNALPTPDEMFGGLAYLGQVVSLLASIYAFVILAVVLVIVRAVIEYVRFSKKLKKAAKPEEANE